MLCLNIRSTIARIGMSTWQGRLEQHQATAELSRDYKAPVAGIYPSGAEVTIDQYPCRRAYGYRNNSDFIREYAQKGLQDVAAGTKRRIRTGNDFMNNGAKYNVVATQARAKITKRNDSYLECKIVPKPDITVRSSKMQGAIDVGHDKVNIKCNQVEQHYTPGKLDIYLDQKNSIRMWTSEGKYDIYV